MEDEYSAIPERTMKILRAYANQHCPTGGFLQAVLSNDLKGALGTADKENLIALKEIVKWIYWEVPYTAQGSPEKYATWIKEFKPGGKNNE